MASDPDPSLLSRLPILLGCLLTVYVLGYFPAKSLIVRHTEYWKMEVLWAPLPSPVKRGLFDAWSAIDPQGRDILRDPRDLIY